MTDVAIVAAKRTAIGTFNGAYSAVNADVLGTTAIKAALDAASLDADAPS